MRELALPLQDQICVGRLPASNYTVGEIASPPKTNETPEISRLLETMETL